jgi:hypothetical protein
MESEENRGFRKPKSLAMAQKIWFWLDLSLCFREIEMDE